MAPSRIIPLAIRPPQTSPDPSPNWLSPVAIPMVKLGQLAMVTSWSDMPPHLEIHYVAGADAAADLEAGPRQ